MESLFLPLYILVEVDLINKYFCASLSKVTDNFTLLIKSVQKFLQQDINIIQKTNFIIAAASILSYSYNHSMFS